MAMLHGPANGYIMVRHVLDVREGALPSNHTIPTLSLFPRFKYIHSKNKMLRVLQMVYRRYANHRVYLKIRPMSYFHDGNL